MVVVSSNRTRRSSIPFTYVKKHHCIITDTYIDTGKRGCLKGSRAGALARSLSVHDDSTNSHDSSRNDFKEKILTKMKQKVKFCQQMCSLQSSPSSSSCDDRNQIFMILSLLEYANDVWWSKYELNDFRCTYEKKSNDDPLKTYLNTHQQVRQKFHDICSMKTKNRKNVRNDNNSDDDNTGHSDDDCNKHSLSFQSLSKEYYKTLVSNIRHDDVLGLERYIGDDSIKRKEQVHTHVQKTVNYYKMLIIGKENMKNMNRDDFIMTKMRKFSEANTTQARYWARYVGNIVSVAVLKR